MRRASSLAMGNLGRLFVSFSFDPDLSVGEMLLLPDRNQALQAIDTLQGGGEGRFTVGGGDDNGHAGFTDLEASQTMDHRDAANLEGASDVVSEFGHHLHCHRLITFIVKETGRAAFGVVTHYAGAAADR